MTYNHKTKKNSHTDYVLLGILLLLNILSGGTTILGAQQVLPSSLAVLGGLAVQTMLFLLLAGWAMRYSIYRRALAVFFFSALSVYTSFFCYYDVLAKKTDQRDAFSKAAAAHSVFLSKSYLPLEDRLRTLKDEADKLKLLSDQECNVGITTGNPGCGPKYMEILKSAGEKTIEYENLRNLLKDIKPKFNYSLDNLSANQIYLRDVELSSSIPANIVVAPKISQEEYISRDFDISLLTPYYKVFKSETRSDSATLALLIALCVDGMAIIQGTAIEAKRERKSLIELLSGLLQALIVDIKSLVKTIRLAATQPGVSFEDRSRERTMGSKGPLRRQVFPRDNSEPCSDRDENIIDEDNSIGWQEILRSFKDRRDN